MAGESATNERKPLSLQDAIKTGMYVDPADFVDNEAGIGGESEEGTEPTQDLEAKQTEDDARAQGWVPRAEFRGPASQWVDAETFVARGHQINAVLKTNNRKLLDQVHGLNTQLADMRSAINEFREYHLATEKRAYESALSDLKARQEAAIEDGDTGAALKYQDQLSELRAAEPKLAPPEKQTPVNQTSDQEAGTQKVDPAFLDWMGRNEWFGTDQIKTQLTMNVGEALHKERPELQGPAFLDELAQQLVRRYPGRFKGMTTTTSNARREDTRQEGAGGGPAPRGRKTAADLPADARAAMSRFVTQGLMTEADYLKEYFR